MGTSFSYRRISNSDNTQKNITKRPENEIVKKLEYLTCDKAAQLLKTKKEEEEIKLEKKTENFLKYVEENKIIIRKKLEDSLEEYKEIGNDKYFAIASTDLYFEWQKCKICHNQILEILKLSSEKCEITFSRIDLSSDRFD